MTNFNPPTPCGVGRISSAEYPICLRFQSTHPVWGGTLPPHPFLSSNAISIHPPRVGWDGGETVTIRYRRDFNPPTPCGVGHHNDREENESE